MYTDGLIISLIVTSRSSSRARITLDTASDGPTSMIQERQPANHHYNYHSGRDFSSFDCYQIDNSRKMVSAELDSTQLIKGERNVQIFV